jgi:hypothetical protein
MAGMSRRCLGSMGPLCSLPVQAPLTFCWSTSTPASHTSSPSKIPLASSSYTTPPATTSWHATYGPWRQRYEHLG